MEIFRKDVIAQVKYGRWPSSTSSCDVVDLDLGYDSWASKVGRGWQYNMVPD